MNAAIPELPPILTFPMNFVPAMLNSTILVTVLNKLLVDALQDGELDFLSKKILLIKIQDAGLEFQLTKVGDRLIVCDHRSPDISIEGKLYDFLLLITRHEDPDTLFFNRRLRLSGSTELGLYLKNFLDSLEPEEYLGSFLKHLEKIVQLFEHRRKFV
ncbi:SCP2 sterol-binding domain-containing protein [Candidatus Halobeggiatoa sp. HSG11]|nr:SCP2 sterol-binding domain-containing protein [Candidatus Halobeggiatoa sp. HSG11]